MCTQFTRAIVRPPCATFANGVTTSLEGAPDLALALEQHAAYVRALEQLGLAVTGLSDDPAYPDSTFVEDTAIVTPEGAVITRPGAPSRAGETTAIAAALAQIFGALRTIEAPGTVDGGDICETDDVVLIGVTARTNEAGAHQLAGHLGELGRKAELVDIRSVPSLLHLKTGVSYLGDGRMAVAQEVADLEALKRFEPVVVATEESYAANCIRVNDRVLVAAGYPRFAQQLENLGYRPLALGMSEFRKLDGGLSCLSLRF